MARFPAGIFAGIVVPALVVAGTPGCVSAQQPGGITVEEYYSNFPPAPADVRIERRNGRAFLAWSRPPASLTDRRLAYDPVVSRYKVFRLRLDGGETLLGETESLRFPLPASAGASARFGVRAVQRSGHESGLSQDVGIDDP